MYNQHDNDVYSLKDKNKMKELLKLLSVALWLMIIFGVTVVASLVAFDVFTMVMAVFVNILIIFLSSLIIDVTVFRKE